MNIVFMDSRFVKYENWQYLIDVLKISEIFCFNPSTELIDTLMKSRTSKINVTFQGRQPEEVFAKTITFRIANLIKSSVAHIDTTSENPSEKFPFCNTSKRFAPFWNIRHTQDANFLILGSINCVQHDNSIFIKRISQYRDLSADIVLFALNILKKQLNSDIYRERICSFMINSISSEEFLLTRYGWRTPTKRLLPRINHLLKESYPHVFPPIMIGGKTKATSFYNLEILNQ